MERAAEKGERGLVSIQNEVIRVENVTKDVRPGFGLRKKRILHDISLSVEQGEIFGFVGPNGAGKTTTMKVLMGLINEDDRAAILRSISSTCSSAIFFTSALARSRSL